MKLLFIKKCVFAKQGTVFYLSNKMMLRELKGREFESPQLVKCLIGEAILGKVIKKNY
jgi:hypothetical protein